MCWLQSRTKKRVFVVGALMLLCGRSLFLNAMQSRKGKAGARDDSALRGASATVQARGWWPGAKGPLQAAKERRERLGLQGSLAFARDRARGLERQLSLTTRELKSARETLAGIEGLTETQQKAVQDILAQLDQEKYDKHLLHWKMFIDSKQRMARREALLGRWQTFQPSALMSDVEREEWRIAAQKVNFQKPLFARCPGSSARSALLPTRQLGALSRGTSAGNLAVLGCAAACNAVPRSSSLDDLCRRKKLPPGLAAGACSLGMSTVAVGDDDVVAGLDVETSMGNESPVAGVDRGSSPMNVPVVESTHDWNVLHTLAALGGLCLGSGLTYKWMSAGKDAEPES